MKTISFNLEGMTCGGCVRSVERVLSGLTGIQNSKVEIGKADVTFDPSIVSGTDIHSALVKTGFSVTETPQQ